MKPITIRKISAFCTRPAGCYIHLSVQCRCRRGRALSPAPFNRPGCIPDRGYLANAVRQRLLAGRAGNQQRHLRHRHGAVGYFRKAGQSALVRPPGRKMPGSCGNVCPYPGCLRGRCGIDSQGSADQLYAHPYEPNRRPDPGSETGSLLRAVRHTDGIPLPSRRLPHRPCRKYAPGSGYP